MQEYYRYYQVKYFSNDKELIQPLQELCNNQQYFQHHSTEDITSLSLYSSVVDKLAKMLSTDSIVNIKFAW